MLRTRIAAFGISLTDQRYSLRVKMIHVVVRNQHQIRFQFLHGNGKGMQARKPFFLKYAIADIGVNGKAEPLGFQ